MGGDKNTRNRKSVDDGKKEWMDDDIELANKTVQQKSSKSFVRLDKESSEEDEDESESEDEEEALMDVSSSLSSSESSDDDEENEEEEFLEDSEDDEAGLLRAMKAQKKKLEYARLRNRAEHSDDEEEEKDSEEDDDVGVRGKRKQDFYGDEEIDHEDAEEEEDRKDEEAAARAAQKQRAGKMRLGDFGLEDEEEDSEEEASSSSEEEDEEDSEEMTLQQKAQRSKLGAKKTPLEEEEEEEKGKQKKKKRSKTSDGGSGGVVVEALDDDEKRAKREKLENASANADEAEEVRALAEELQKTLAEVETNVEPIVKSAKRGEYLTEEGISYLDTKYMLLLSYCVNLTFYLLMKSEGKSIKDHPVVMRLVEIRSYIEKLRPIDKKLHYQIEKLLKVVNEDGAAGGDNLQFKPNPSALVGRGEGAEGEDEEGDGKYRPPKMLPTTMEQDEDGKEKSNKEKRREKEQRRRAQRSSLIKELAHELGEDPEEIQDGEANDRNAFVKREHARMEARARIEEDLFTRVPLTKQERKRQNATTRNISSIAAIGDFGDDVADLVERAQELDELPSNDRKRRLVDVVQDGNRSMPIGIRSGRRDTGEEDVPLRDTLGERRQKYEKGALRHHERHEHAMREHEDAMRARPNEPRRDLGANEEYDLALSHRDRKRLEKQQKYTREQRMAVAPEDDAEGRREIGGKIMSNRGLTPHRSKDMKNPRVRLKNKFAKAVVRRKGTVRDMKVGATTYGGEETGVKTSVIKSRKL
ncbi:unnamed protein product [Bathycoccus prasinos]